MAEQDNVTWRISSHTLRDLGDEELLRKTMEIRRREAATTAELCAHLAEIKKRGLYLQYEQSLYHYAQKHLGLSEGETATRVQVANASRKYPLLIETMATGRLSLTAAAKLCPYLDDQDSEKLIDDCAG